MVTIILDYMRAINDNDKSKTIDFAKAETPAFHQVSTGFNDKYAYGVATRMVYAGRGNKEG